MASANASSRHTSRTRADRRLGAGIAVSVLLHALLLSIQFGVPGLDLGSGGPISVTLAPPDTPPPEAAPSVPASAAPAPLAPLATAPAAPPLPLPPRPAAGLRLVDPLPPAPVLARTAKQAAKPRPRKRTRVAAPRRRVPPVSTPLIAAQPQEESTFSVPLPDVVPEEKLAQAGDPSAQEESAGKTELAEPAARESADDGEQEALRLAAEEERQRQLALEEQERLAAAARQEEERRREEQQMTERRLAEQQAEAQRLAEQRLEEQRLEENRLALERERAAQLRQREQEDLAARQQAERRVAEEAAAREQALVRQRTEETTQRQVAERRREEEARLAQERAQAEELVRRRLAEERTRQEVEERARVETERLAQERARAESERLAQERTRAEAERLAQERARAETERLVQERARAEAERLAQEHARADAERLAQERAQEARRLEEGRMRAQAPGPGGLEQGQGQGQGGNGAGPGAGGRAQQGALAGDLGTRARDMLRGLSIPSATPPPTHATDTMPNARRVVSDGGERDVPLRLYIDSVRQKLERNAVLGDARFAVREVRIDPLVSLSLRSDGSVDDVTIVRSSGRPDMDEAVRRFVRLNARYSAFPPNVAARFDVIEIRRIWTFAEGLKLVEELR